MSHANTETSGGGLPPPPTGSDPKNTAPDPVGTFEEENPFDWRVKFRTDAVSQIEKWSKELGVSKFAIDAFVRDHMDGAIGYIKQVVFTPNAVRKPQRNRDTGDMELGPSQGWTPTTSEDFEQIWQAGIAYYSMQSGLNFANPPGKAGSGTGSRGPSAQDIRNMFDEDQLTDAANAIWQSRLVEEAPDARGMAKAYINEVVRTRGEQELDFETFILNKAKATSRWNLIYQNKPESQSEMAYIQPYVQAAQAAMGGAVGQNQDASSVAVGGAALGTDPAAFQQRLARTSANQNSQGFITGLEDRVRGVKDLLRG